MAKNCCKETGVRSLGWADPLEKGTATHSSFLAWRILWTEDIVHGVAKSRIQLERLSVHTRSSPPLCIQFLSLEGTELGQLGDPGMALSTH